MWELRIRVGPIQWRLVRSFRNWTEAMAGLREQQEADPDGHYCIIDYKKNGPTKQPPARMSIWWPRPYRAFNNRRRF